MRARIVPPRIEAAIWRMPYIAHPLDPIPAGCGRRKDDVINPMISV
jgi:hypothetical protein